MAEKKVKRPKHIEPFAQMCVHDGYGYKDTKSLLVRAAEEVGVLRQVIRQAQREFGSRSQLLLDTTTQLHFYRGAVGEMGDRHRTLQRDLEEATHEIRRLREQVRTAPTLGAAIVAALRSEERRGHYSAPELRIAVDQSQSEGARPRFYVSMWLTATRSPFSPPLAVPLWRADTYGSPRGLEEAFKSFMPKAEADPVSATAPTEPQPNREAP